MTAALDGRVAGLGGRRIALFEARLADELSALVRRSGGAPVCVPAVRESALAAGPALAALLDAVAGEAAPIFVFSTGVGASGLFAQARALGLEPALRAAIGRGLTVCRGPKPVTALHREGIAASVRAPSPFTTGELLGALAAVEVADRAVVVVHHGERNPPLTDALRARGARLHELLLYEWTLPADLRPLQAMVEDLAAGRFAAVAFTTQIQARHLFAVAESIGRGDALREALRTRVVVAAVGPTCARVLAELGVPAQVVPDSPKMGPMLGALVERLSQEVAR